jgi:hypothetical protein
VSTNTPLWVPLVVAGIAVLGTLSGAVAGAVIAQHQANRREDKTWLRERERERENRAREDEARTFEHRREAYSDFYEAVKAMARMVYDTLSEEDDLPDDWYSEAFGKLSRLSLYADRRVAFAASDAYTAAWYWGMNMREGQRDENMSEAAAVEAELEVFNKGWGKYQQAERELLVLMREALSIPEGDLTLPPPIATAAPDGFSPE